MAYKTDKEILTKAMAIAKRGGFDISEEFFTEVPVEYWLTNQDLYYSLIFDHGFAKAFFGKDERICFEGAGKVLTLDLTTSDKPMNDLMNPYFRRDIPVWQMHYINMQFHHRPLRYLETFIDEYEDR